MSTTANYIPKYTDEPEMFLFCSIQELTVGAFFFMGFAWVGHELTAVLAFLAVDGGTSAKALRELRLFTWKCESPTPLLNSCGNNFQHQ